MSPPSSGSKGEPSMKLADAGSLACLLILLVSCLVYNSTLKMEAIYSSEMLRTLLITQRYKPEDRTPIISVF
jgi:hypothetical protein